MFCRFKGLNPYGSTRIFTAERAFGFSALSLTNGRILPFGAENTSPLSNCPPSTAPLGNELVLGRRGRQPFYFQWGRQFGGGIEGQSRLKESDDTGYIILDPRRWIPWIETPEDGVPGSETPRINPEGIMFDADSPSAMHMVLEVLLLTGEAVEPTVRHPPIAPMGLASS